MPDPMMPPPTTPTFPPMVLLVVRRRDGVLAGRRSADRPVHGVLPEAVGRAGSRWTGTRDAATGAGPRCCWATRRPRRAVRPTSRRSARDQREDDPHRTHRLPDVRL